MTAMIVVDTSVLVDHFNGRSTPETMFLRSLMHHRQRRRSLIIVDIVLCETLQGAPSPGHARVMLQTLRRLGVLSALDPELAVVAAGYYRAMRQAGVTIRSTIDVIIAAFCIQENYQLLHADRDFDQMNRCLDLKVVPTTWEVHEQWGCYGLEH